MFKKFLQIENYQPEVEEYVEPLTSQQVVDFLRAYTCEAYLSSTNDYGRHLYLQVVLDDLKNNSGEGIREHIEVLVEILQTYITNEYLNLTCGIIVEEILEEIRQLTFQEP